MRASAKENQTIVDNENPNTANNGVGLLDTKTHNIFDVTVDQQSGYAIGKKDKTSTETPPTQQTTCTLSGTTYEIRKVGNYSKANVTVDVLDSSGNVVKSVISDKNGDYSISGLSAGTYTVRFSFANVVKTTSTTLSGDTDLDMAFSPMVTTNPNTPAPITTGAVIGNIWNDLNGDKLANDNSGVANLRVSLGRFVNGKFEMLSTYTDANGNYRFDNVATGSWTVCMSKPTSFSYVTGGDSQVSSIGAKSVSIVAGNVIEVNGAVAQAAKVSGTVFNDLNGNGTQDIGESGKAGVLVYVKGSDGMSMGATMTNAQGDYTITGLTAGNATVVFGNNNALFSSGSATTAVQLTGGKTTDCDAGMKQPVNITGKLFSDLNADGVRDANEVGLAYKFLKFIDESGKASYTFTDANGNYSLNNVVAGKYTVSYSLSDGSIITGNKTFSATADKTIHDVGSIKYYTQSGTVWSDKDADGIWDSDETGRAGVTVSAINNQGQVVDHAVTNAAGLYTFTHLVDSTHKILVDLAQNEAISYQENLNYRPADLYQSHNHLTSIHLGPFSAA